MFCFLRPKLFNSTIRVWETQTWGCEKLLEDHHGPVYALTVLEGKLVSSLYMLILSNQCTEMNFYLSIYLSIFTTPCFT